MALALGTICSSIAGLAVSGVTLKDIDAIPEKVEVRDCPIIFPKPDGFITDFNLVVDSFGSASAKKTVSYHLNYVLLQAPVGQGRGLFDLYEGFVTNVAAFLDALIANDAITGAVDMQPAAISSFGPTPDPSGGMFHGAVITLAVQEFVN
jgi:hypothetical protein